jgi:hypothetical protein
MTKRTTFSALALLAALGLAAPAFAAAAPDTKSATPKLIGTYSAWKAYSYGGGDQPVCYMTLTAHFAPNKKMKRGDAYLMITHRPSENSKDVVSYAAGYNFKTTSPVDLVIGKKTFDLFTQAGTAWSRDAATDHALAAAIQAGTTIQATGTPATKGATPITDTIDIKGAAQAYYAIGKACGYPVTAPAAPKPAAKAPAKAPAKKTHK